jgi:hypothetical protein
MYASGSTRSHGPGSDGGGRARGQAAALRAELDALRRLHEDAGPPLGELAELRAALEAEQEKLALQARGSLG